MILTLRRTRRVALALAATLVFATAGFAAPPDGKTVYKHNCALCHGPEGTPNAMFAKKKVPDFRDAAWQKSKTDADLKKVVTEGVKDTLMRSFTDRLTPEEIDAVLAYVRTLAPKK
jgi:mono/diheme cytochrome c family protein